MPEGAPLWKDIVAAYEQGKHRRYGLLFAVNGGAFAIAKVLAASFGQNAPVQTASVQNASVLGGLTLSMLALGMAAFTAVMGIDIFQFGRRMRALDDTLFGFWGRLVLALLCALIIGGWLMVGFAPLPGGGRPG
jgi:hypothetical protein